MLPIYTSKHAITPESLRLLPKISIGHNLNRQPINSSLEMALVLDLTRLYFYAKVPIEGGVTTIPHHEPQAFIEGLWDGEVSELFIASKNTSHYIEINLAPQAAWWFCEFSNYRVRSPFTLPIDDVVTFYASTTEYWEACVGILRNSLPNWIFEENEISGNLTACLSGDNRQLISLAKLPIVNKPDFHSPSNFINILKLPLDSQPITHESC